MILTMGNFIEIAKYFTINKLINFVFSENFLLLFQLITFVFYYTKLLLWNDVLKRISSIGNYNIHKH